MSARQGECPHGWPLVEREAPEQLPVPAPDGEPWVVHVAPDCALCAATGWRTAAQGSRVGAQPARAGAA